jgi:hypothetical protein
MRTLWHAERPDSCQTILKFHEMAHDKMNAGVTFDTTGHLPSWSRIARMKEIFTGVLGECKNCGPRWTIRCGPQAR